LSSTAVDLGRRADNITVILMNKIISCITFHFDRVRLKYLIQTITGIRHAGIDQIIICTNAKDEALEEVRSACQFMDGIYVLSIVDLAHPYHLAMYHRSVFSHYFHKDDSITHFLYSEDDHLFSKTNLNYWFESFEELRSVQDYGIPAWFRIELRHSDQSWVSIDYSSDIPLEASRVNQSGQNFYVDSIRSYAGAYMLDRSLMGEFMKNPDYLHIPPPPQDSNYYSVREHAAFGMARTGLKDGSLSRYRIRLNKYLNVIDPAAYIVHLPNNYANAGLWDCRKLSDFKFLKP
jgi:hypothetical protein